MADKYSDLPDIDNESQDVFETSDLESEAEISANTPNASESDRNSEIDENDFDSKQARNRFSNDVIVGDIDIVNFSGSISNTFLGRNGYQVAKVDETVEQKLARISRELQEIKLSQSTGGTTESNKIESERLLKLLEEITSESDSDDLNQYSQRVNVLFEQASRHLSPIDISKSIVSPPELVDTSEILALESRINALESLLGIEAIHNFQSTSAGTIGSNKTIQNHLNDLSRKINIIYNPEYQMGKVKQEIEELNRETERLASNRKLLEISQSPAEIEIQKEYSPIEAKINDLHSRLAEFDKINSIATPLLNRLKSLHMVHLDLSNCVDTVNNLDQILNDLSDDIHKWDDSLNKINGDLDIYETNFKSNKQEINQWIEELTERVNKLI